MATAYPLYSPASAPGLAQFLDADTCKVGILQTVGDAYVGGKLGVGTLTPATPGHFASGATGGTILTLEQAYGDADAPDLTIKKARGTIAAPTVITTADELGMISFAGYSGAGGYVVGAAIKATSEGTIATTRVPGRLTFWTGTDAAPTVLTERMRIDSAGNVGINNTSPSVKLDIQSTVGNFIRFSVTGQTTANYLGLNNNHDFLFSCNGQVNVVVNSDGSDPGTDGFYVWNTNTSGTPKLSVLATSGKVGIGIGVPTSLLHVKGSGSGFLPFKLESTSDQQIGMSIKKSTKEYILGVDLGNNGEGDFFIWDGTAAASRLSINTTGSVGIGITAPHALTKLHVSGGTGVRTQYLLTDNATQSIFMAAGNSHANGSVIASDGQLMFRTGVTYANGADDVSTGVSALTLLATGKAGFGVSPTAVLHLKAGTTAASTAPLKLTSGDLMTAPEAGAIEFLTDTFYGTITTGVARKAFAFAADVVPTSRTITAGTGLSGGGDLTANRTLSLDQAVIPTWTGAHTFTGGVTFKNHSAFAGSGFIPETRAIQTTTVTPAVLWSKTLADDTLYWVEVRVIGRDTAGVERAYYGRTFYVYRQSAGSATLGNVIELFSEETDADWDVGVNVNTNDVEVKVTGKGSVTINWAGTVTMQAVSGNA